MVPNSGWQHGTPIPMQWRYSEKKSEDFPDKKGITTTQQTTKNLKFMLNKNVYEQLMSERNHPILFSFFKKHVALPRWAKDCCWSPWRNITPSKLKYLSGSRVRTLGWKGLQKWVLLVKVRFQKWNLNKPLVRFLLDIFFRKMPWYFFFRCTSFR